MDTDPIELEIRLDALLCGQLSLDDRQEILDRVATDESARALLAEMIECRRLAREAFGYDKLDAAIAESMARLTLPPLRPARTGWVRRAIGWPLVAAASLLLALGAMLWPRPTPGPAGVARAPAVPALTARQVDRLRQLWTAIAAGDGATWILVRDGGESFEQLPPTDSRAGEGAVSLRCVFAAADGKVIDDFQILLPARTSVPLAIGEAGRIAGRPVRCDVSAEGGWVALHVNVEDKSGGAVGLQGRVKTGQGATEIGEFRLGGREIKVFLQAVKVS